MGGVASPVVPVPSTADPKPESSTGTAGTNPTAFAMEGHQHPRLTSALVAQTDANGLITGHMFTRTFVNMPCPVMSCINVAGAVAVVTSWIQDAQNLYIGCNIAVTKRTATTTTNSVTVVGIPVIGSVTTTMSDTPVPNQAISIIMLQQSGS